MTNSTEPQDNEAIYDAEIAPVLAKLAERCTQIRMPFIAVAEYRPGEHGRTAVSVTGQGLAMSIVGIAAQTGVNVDALMINIMKHCQQNGIDTGASIFLRRLHD